MPGPICFGRGGTEPTITDANLLLGRLDPDRLLAVDEAPSLDALKTIFDDKLAGPLGVDAVEAAGAVLKIANLKMAGAIRMVSLAKGNDPRELMLYAFGGAGPLHAADLARELGIPRVFVPARPGITNAIGCVVADLQHDYVNTLNKLVHDIAPEELNGLIDDQVASGMAALAAETIRPVEIRMEHSLDMQFAGQTHLIRVPIDGKVDDMDAIQTLFEEAYYKRFRVRLPEVRALIVNVNTSVIGLREPAPLADLIPREGRADTIDAAKTGSRQVWFDGQWMEAAIYEREKLPLLARIEGPAILAQFDSTTVLPPDCVAEGDREGNIIIQVSGDARG